MSSEKQMLWWGRFDPGYSRNGVLRRQLAALGWTVRDFRPGLCAWGDLEAALRRLPTPDLVWVPCFRQRDLAAARRWCDRRGVPLLFDPLISAYDKQVFERGKHDEASGPARRLLAWERGLFGAADGVVADTAEHARYYVETLGARPERVRVVYVGADEALFRPAEPEAGERPVEVLFYGSFIPLHGARTIVEAARLYRGPAVRWCLLGDGPHRRACEEAARGLANVVFEAPIPYGHVAGRIHRADILVGVFGRTQKAGRVIPNKVFQALACGRPVITRVSAAYPDGVKGSEALAFLPPGDAAALAREVGAWAGDRAALAARGRAARRVYEGFFSADVVRGQLREALAPFGG